MVSRAEDTRTECGKLKARLAELERRYLTLFEHSAVPNCEADLSGAKKRLDWLRRRGVTDLARYLHDHPEDPLISDYGTCWQVIRMNSATFGLPGVEPDAQGIFATYNEQIISDPDVRDNHIFYLKEFFAGKRNFEYEITRRAPPLRSTLIKISVPPDDEDTLARVYVTNHDLTGLREAEKRVREYQQELEERVRTRTALLHQEVELRKQEEEKSKELYREEQLLHRRLKKEMKQRTSFLRCVVHEIRTPLTSVVAAGELLTAQSQEELPRKLAKHLYQSACDLDSRINELYDFTKSEMGTLRVTPAEVDDLAELLHDTLESVRPQTVLKEQNLTSEIADNLPSICADSTRVRQVILNILNNAIKFTPRGGAIKLSACVQDDCFVVAVADNGPGIEKAKQARLFQPYYTGSGHYSGLGLGLPIAKYLVKQHRGRIWVESDGSGGSTFSFSIPLGKKQRGGVKK